MQGSIEIYIIQRYISIFNNKKPKTSSQVICQNICMAFEL